MGGEVIPKINVVIRMLREVSMEFNPRIIAA
jgi:hypothetical protein